MYYIKQIILGYLHAAKFLSLKTAKTYAKYQQTYIVFEKYRTTDILNHRPLVYNKYYYDRLNSVISVIFNNDNGG